MIRLREAAATLLCLALLPARGLPAQDRPGPWVPVGSRLDRLASWVIAEGALPAVDPLTRPFRLAALRRAVQDQDTAALSTDGRRAFEWLQSELEALADSTAVVAELGADAWRNGRRDSFRAGGGQGAGPAGGIWISLARGPFVGVFNPAFENRLKDDPEFTGDTSRFIAGRLQNGYMAVTGERGDLIVGRLGQAWGPGLFDGLQLSMSAYATDLIEGSLREGRFALTTIAQRLDDDDTTLSTPVNRYFFAHRLTVRAGRGTWLAFTESGIYGGPGRGFEPAFLLPISPAILAEANDGKRVNIFWGASVHAPLGNRIAFEGELLLDDIQVDRDTTLSGHRPWSGGFTGVLTGALPGTPLHASLGYTRVRSLTYRNASDVWDTYDIRGIGIGRNFADYDQSLVRLEARPSLDLNVALELSYIRQGAGDFRLPFPADSVLAQPGQGFLLAPVARTAGARLTASGEPIGGVMINAALGINRRSGGGSAAIVALSVRLRLDVLKRRWGAGYAGVETGGAF